MLLKVLGHSASAEPPNGDILHAQAHHAASGHVSSCPDLTKEEALALNLKRRACLHVVIKAA